MKLVQKKGKFFVPTKESKKLSLAPEDVYARAKKDRIKFWEGLAREGIIWSAPWKKVYEQKGLNYKWFIDGKLNLCYNAVDRHLDKPDNIAIIFVPENVNDAPVIMSYFELYKQVNNAAAKLLEAGVKKGDVVAIYLPMIPETLITMLACQRIGAIHTVVFSAFSAEALRTRIEDGGAKVLVSMNFYYRKGEKADLEGKANEACNGLNIQKLILDRNNVGKIFAGESGKFVKCEQMEANETSFILYTSGTTGKPKGIMHAVGGYAVQAYWSCRYVFNLKEGEIMWCTADIGWITGHTYACYGPLLNGATTLVFEGLPNYPTNDRFLQIIEENEVSVFYTAPTALRMFALEGSEYTKKYKLPTLKILGSVGEPIDEKTWMWFFNNVGKGRIPLIDTYWQTETGSAVIDSLPGIGPFIPTFAAVPFPGIEFTVVDEKGKEVKKGKEGFLVQKAPFAPATLRGVWKNEERYKKYFLKGYYNTEDRAYQDKDGYFRILGRGDDVIKVAGHRLSTAEIENAILTIPNVGEAVIVGKPDEIRGMVPVAFVKTKGNVTEQEVVNSVLKKIGPIAKPAEVYFVPDIPKTRSGKMMRRIMKAILANEDVGNTTTLVNPECVEEIKKIVEERKTKK